MQSPSATAGQKRKRPDEAKYYAVKVGAEPGIYRTYADCIKQVNGFKGGLCWLLSVPLGLDGVD